MTSVSYIRDLTVCVTRPQWVKSKFHQSFIWLIQQHGWTSHYWNQPSKRSMISYVWLKTSSYKCITAYNNLQMMPAPLLIIYASVSQVYFIFGATWMTKHLWIRLTQIKHHVDALFWSWHRQPFVMDGLALNWRPSELLHKLTRDNLKYQETRQIWGIW